MGELPGCRELSNVLDSSTLMADGYWMLVGCFRGGDLEHLHETTPDGLGHAVNLGGIALDQVGTVGSANHPPVNLLMTDETPYLVRGDQERSNGVVARALGGGGRPWQHALTDVSEVRLLAADDDAVIALAITPGPATLHTIHDANRATPGQELDPAASEKLPNADQATRVGDYLVCAFDSLEDTTIGVLRAED
ncbi:hypothetical protein [Actinophytocola sediminis]